MKRALLSLFALFAFASLALADVRDRALKPGDAFIPMAFRYRNHGPQCVWAASSTITATAGYDALDGAVERARSIGWHGSGMGAVEAVFRQANIPYKATRTGDIEILKQGAAQGTGCYVEIPGHALVCVGFDESGVRILDNNGPPVVQEWSHAKFSHLWNGCAVFPIFRRRVHPHPGPRPGPLPLPINPTPAVVPAPDPAPPVPGPEPLPAPTPAPTVGPAGPAGPAGPPGKDGASIDTTALVAKIGDMVESKLSTRDKAISSLQTDLATLKSQVADIHIRIVPKP